MFLLKINELFFVIICRIIFIGNIMIEEKTFTAITEEELDKIYKNDI